MIHGLAGSAGDRSVGSRNVGHAVFIDREGGRYTLVCRDVCIRPGGSEDSIAPCNEVIACIRNGRDGGCIRTVADKLRGIS